jgi:hypothetical protein
MRVTSRVGRLDARGAHHLARSEPPSGAPAPRFLPLAVASQEVDASLVDARSSAKTAWWTTDSPPLSPVQGHHRSHCHRGQPSVVDAEAHLDPALVRAATQGHAMVVAPTVAVNCTPPS